MVRSVRANDSLVKTPQVAIAFWRVTFIGYNTGLVRELGIPLNRLTPLDSEQFEDPVNKQPFKGCPVVLYALHTFRRIAVLWIKCENIVEIANIEHLRHWLMFATL